MKPTFAIANIIYRRFKGTQGCPLMHMAILRYVLLDTAVVSTEIGLSMPTMRRQ